MAEFINVKIIGVDPVSAASNVIARSSTGGGASGAQWQLLNVHSLGNIWIHSLSGGFPAALTASTASAMGNIPIVGTATATLNSVSAYAYCFLKLIDDAGSQWAIPLLKPTGI